MIKYSELSEVENIAAGEFGVVYRANHPVWQTVAYKELTTKFIATGSQFVYYSFIVVWSLHNYVHPSGRSGLVLIYHTNCDVGIHVVMSCMRVCRKQALSRVKYYYYVTISKIQQATIMTVIMTK